MLAFRGCGGVYFKVVAAAWSPNAPPKKLFDCIPVCYVGSKGLKALSVAPVSLISNGVLPSSTPNWRHFFACLLSSPTGAVLVNMVMWEGECYLFV